MTPTERFTDNEERHHAMEQRIAAEGRFREACEAYPHLADAMRSAADAARARRLEEITYLEAELEKKKELLVLSDASGLDVSEELELWNLINRSTGTWVV